MKKILIIAAMLAMFASCKSVEQKAQDYIDNIFTATENGDWGKALKLSEEMAEWTEGLSEEDQKKVAGIMFNNIF